MPAETTLWDRCIRLLQAELPEQQFNTWIRPLQAIEDVSHHPPKPPGPGIARRLEHAVKSVEVVAVHAGSTRRETMHEVRVTVIGDVKEPAAGAEPT